MRIQGAIIKEQGQTFAVVVVKPSVLRSQTTVAETIESFMPAFGGVPIVLMAQDGRGRPTYYGRRDIAQFMSKVPIHRVPWKEYSIG